MLRHAVLVSLEKTRIGPVPEVTEALTKIDQDGTLVP